MMQVLDKPRAPILKSASVWIVFFLTGISGFLLGILVYPSWQHAIEGAQVVSGVVQYPGPSPFYLYQANVWTLLHQIPAIFLALGVSEKTLCLIMSGILGMFSYQALGLATLAFSEDMILSLLSPFLVHFTKTVSFGVVYVILLLGTFTTYGIAGLSYLVMTLSLISLGRKRAGYFMLGLAPAIHPALGLFGIMVIFFAAGVDSLFLGKKFQVSWRPFLIGLGTASLSYLYKFFSIHGMPKIPFHETAPYLDAFVRHWCGHRGPVVLNTPGFMIQMAASCISFLILRFFHKELSPATYSLLLFSCVAGCLAVPLALISWIPPEWISPLVIALMPARFLNFNIFLFPTLLMGLMAREKDSLWIQSLFVITLLVLLLLARHSLLHSDWIAATLIISGAIFIILKFKKLNSVEIQSPLTAKLQVLTKLLFFAVLLKSISMSFTVSAENRFDFNDKKDEAFWTSVAKDQGMLLTSFDVNLVQLRSRRPVLLETAAIDGFPYALQSAPFMNSILKELYSADLLKPPSPPDEPLIEEEENKALWEKKDAAEWKLLAKKYVFSQILTTSSWNLKLPVRAQNNDYILYQV